MKLVLAAFVLVLLLGGGYLLMLAGPHAFDPPLRYALTLRLELSVDGQRYVSSQGALCEVHDQRNSIAVGDYHTKTVFENPYVLLPDGRAVVVSSMAPCKWAKAAPVKGRVYHMIDLADPNTSGMSITRPYAEDEVSMSGRLVLVDNIRQPKVSRSTQLSNAEWLDRLGIRVIAVTIVQDEHPVTRPLEAALPFLAAAKAQITKAKDPSPEVRQQSAVATGTRNFSAAILERGEKKPCPVEDAISSVAGWVEIEDQGETCKGRGIGEAPVVLADDFRRIDIDLARRGKSTVTTTAFLSAALAKHVGYFDTGKAGFVWPISACVEGQCFDFLPGARGYKLLYNRKQDLYVAVSLNGGWVADIARTDYF